MTTLKSPFTFRGHLCSLDLLKRNIRHIVDISKLSCWSESGSPQCSLRDLQLLHLDQYDINGGPLNAYFEFVPWMRNLRLWLKGSQNRLIIKTGPDQLNNVRKLNTGQKLPSSLHIYEYTVVIYRRVFPNPTSTQIDLIMPTFMSKERRHEIWSIFGVTRQTNYELFRND